MNSSSSAPSSACAANSAGVFSSARAGKIACLPPHLQEELNHRLAARIPGSRLLPWLNSLPEVQTILRDLFHSQPINHQNLTNWRRGGFLAWQTRHNLLANFRELAADAAAIEESLGSLTDHAARLLAFHFSQILCPRDLIHGRPRPSTPQPPMGHDQSSISNANIKLLCAITRAIASLRRTDHAALRLKLRQQNQQASDSPKLSSGCRGSAAVPCGHATKPQATIPPCRLAPPSATAPSPHHPRPGTPPLSRLVDSRLFKPFQAFIPTVPRGPFVPCPPWLKIEPSPPSASPRLP